MKLNGSFACPSCTDRIKISGEYDGKESRWELDIKTIEDTSEE